MEIRLLGLVEVRYDGGNVALGAAKQRAVLAMLALQANEPVSTDRLMEGLWGEAPPASAAKMVQLYVSQLRKLLHGGDAEIVTRGRGYELRLAADRVDALRFERLVTVAAGEREAANGAAREALSLWRGSPLDDLADVPFAGAEIRRLEELWLRAREVAIDDALAAGHHQQLVGELDELVAEHPLRERLHAQRMLALYRCGRQAEALQAYRDARELLVGEIGVEPGPELRRLHEAILDQDPSLEPAAEERRAPAPTAARVTGAGPSKRAVVLALMLVAVAGVAVVVGRLGAADGLEQIDADAVGVIDPADGRITAQYAVGRGPGPLAAGDGSVWVASAAAGTISRIDHDGEQVTTIDLAGEPTALAFGAGSLWVADGQHRRVAQINPATNRVVRRFGVGNSPRGVAATAGAVWVASSVDGGVDRIDLTRAGAVRQIPLQGGPAALAAGAGAVWVAGEDSGLVTRLEARTGAALAAIGVGNGPAALAVGEGAVWAANRTDGTVSRIDPRTNAVTDTIGVGGTPVDIAAGAGGIWVADAGRGMIARIDPETRRVERRIDVRSSPAGLVVADGSLWTSALAPRTSHRGGTLRFEAPAFEAADPAAAYVGGDWAVISLAYDGLLAYRRVAGTAGAVLVGNLATGVPEPVDDGRTYVFQLRRGLRFSNGSEVRPEDFRASIERLLRLAGPDVPPFFAGIVGTDTCDRDGCDLRSGIETDRRARTITIHLREPEPEFPHKLTNPLAYVVPESAPIRFAGERPLPGTGPYRLAAFDPGRGGRLSRNPHFRSWSEDARPDGFPDEIAFSMVRDRRTAVSAVRRGRADVVQVAGGSAEDLALRDLRALAVADPSHLHSAVKPHTEYIFLNTRRPPFNDIRVRRAFNLAVDRRRVVALLGTRLGQVTCQIVPPGLPGYEPVCPYTPEPSAAGVWIGPDLSRARELVAKSGTAGERIDLWGGTGWSEDVVRYAAQVLRRLGYRARAHFQPDLGRYFEFIHDRRNAVQAGYTGWIADFLTSSNFIAPSFSCDLGTLGGGHTFNPSQFCDSRLDALVHRALATERSAANELWAEADRRVVQAAPIVPLVNRRSVLLVSDRVGNVQQHLQLGPLLDQLWVR